MERQKDYYIKGETDMNGFYIHFGAKKEPGVKKKIDGQIKVLSQLGTVEEIDVPEIPADTLIKKVARRFPVLYKSQWDYRYVQQKLKNPDYVYIRRTIADKYYIRFLKYTKQTYPNCKVLVEIPTYPYFKDDFLKINTWPYLFKELFSIRHFQKYVDRFITYSSDHIIFNVPTISTMNGVDVDAFRPKYPSENKDEIRMLAVAAFRKHHGYERIIKGLYQYYKTSPNRVAKLILVGDGPELEKYKGLVAKWNLEKYVQFAGKHIGAELDAYYNQADLGLGAFGFYKIGMSDSSSLKTREYLLKGLPVISGCPQDIFKKYPCTFHMEFENNRSVVDIQKIVNFYDALYLKYSGEALTVRKEELIKEIHQYALKYASMEEAYRPVIEYLKK